MDAKNVLLVTVDSLRGDRLHEYHRSVAPELQSLAMDGCQFLQTTANGPNTTASFPAILTGSHSMTHGPYGVLDPDTSPFLAQEFSRAGYKTVGYHSNPFLGDTQNYHIGFDTYNDLIDGSESIASLKDRVAKLLNPDSRLFSLLRRAWHTASMKTNTKSYARAETVADGAINWLRDHDSDQPFFMWLHFMDVHYPFDPPKDISNELPFDRPSNRRIVELNGMMQEEPERLDDHDTETLEQLYDAELRYTDQQLGRVIDTIEENVGLDETLVAVTADHGEAFGEHDKFGHHVSPYEELVRVPLIISGANIESRTIRQQVQLLDLPPTLLRLSGLDVPEEMDGSDFVTYITGREERKELEPALIISNNGNTFGVRTEEWKYIHHLESDEKYLYNLETDPQEKINVVADHRGQVNEFDSIISTYRSTVSEEIAEINRTEQTEQRLKDLGYL